MIKTLSLFLTGACFVAGCTILAAADAAPAASSPLTPEQVIALLNSWKEVIFVALGILATVVTWIISRVQSIKEQVCRHGERIDTQQAQIVGIAQNTPPSGPSLTASPDSAPPTIAPPLIKLLIIAAAVLALSGCAGARYNGPPVTVTGEYTTPDGNGTIGASVRLDPAYLRQK